MNAHRPRPRHPAHPTAPTRWRQRVDDPKHDRAARLLQTMAGPRPLTDEQIDRIDEQLAAAQQAASTRHGVRSRAVWMAGAALAAAACLAIGLSIGRQARVDAPTTTPTASDAKVAALGGGTVVFDAAGELRMDGGRAAVRTASQPVRVRAPSLVVTAAPASVIDVDASESRVACYAGSAEVQWFDGPRRLLPAGTAATRTGLVTVDEAARGRALTALSPEAASRATSPTHAEPAAQGTRVAPSPPPPPVTPPMVTRPPATRAPVTPHLATAQPATAPAATPQPAIAQTAIAQTATPRATTPPTVTSPPSAPAPEVAEGDPKAATTESQLNAESRLLSQALDQVHKRRDPAAALRLLDEHQARFPAGQFRPEAYDLRIEALVSAGRHGAALTLLDGRTFSRGAREQELRMQRGELRAEAGRCRDAIEDFAPMVEGSGALAERALYGRAGCRARLGDSAGARADLGLYLARFPNGQYARPARESLAK